MNETGRASRLPLALRAALLLAALALFLDNTIPGTLVERGLRAARSPAPPGDPTS